MIPLGNHALDYLKHGFGAHMPVVRQPAIETSAIDRPQGLRELGFMLALLKPAVAIPQAPSDDALDRILVADQLQELLNRVGDALITTRYGQVACLFKNVELRDRDLNTHAGELGEERRKFLPCHRALGQFEMALDPDAVERNTPVLEAFNKSQHGRPPRRIDGIRLRQAVVVDHELGAGIQLAGEFERPGDIVVAERALEAVASQESIALFGIEHFIDDDPLADPVAVSNKQVGEMAADDRPVASIPESMSRPVRCHLLPQKGVAADCFAGNTRIIDDCIVIAVIGLSTNPLDRAPLAVKLRDKQLAVASDTAFQRSSRNQLVGSHSGAQQTFARLRGSTGRAGQYACGLHWISKRRDEWAGHKSGKHVSSRHKHLSDGPRPEWIRSTTKHINDVKAPAVIMVNEKFTIWSGSTSWRRDLRGFCTKPGSQLAEGTRKLHILRKIFAVLFASSFAADPALAGPWTMSAGEGRVIATTIYSHSGKSFDGSGESVDAPDYDQFTVSFLTEYGLTEDVTLVVNPGMKWIGIKGEEDSFGLDSIELGARYRLFRDGQFIVSAQASAFVPGTLRNRPVAQVTGNDAQFEARLQAGYGFMLGRLRGFTSVEGGYRLRLGSSPDEFRGDATLGVHATDRLMLIGNLFNTWSNGAGGDGFSSYRYSNLYTGGVYAVSPRLSFQLGGLATLGGRNALRERGVYSGFWLKF